MEEQFNEEVKQGGRFAADAARLADGNSSSEDCKHTWCGVFVAVGSDAAAVVDRRRSRHVYRWARRKNRPSAGTYQRRYAGVCRVFLALGRMDAEE